MKETTKWALKLALADSAGLWFGWLLHPEKDPKKALIKQIKSLRRWSFLPLFFIWYKIFAHIFLPEYDFGGLLGLVFSVMVFGILRIEKKIVELKLMVFIYGNKPPSDRS